jgi:hypothetical protein
MRKQAVLANNEGIAPAATWAWQLPKPLPDDAHRPGILSVLQYKGFIDTGGAAPLSSSRKESKK